MNVTEIRETLREVADASSVPPPDQAVFGPLVRRARRRRTAVRISAGIAAAALVLGGVAAGDLVSGLRSDGGQVADGPTAPVAWAGTPVLQEGALVVVGPQGSVLRTGLRMAHLVGATPQGVVGLTEDDELVRAQGAAAELLTDDRVQEAYLDGDGIVYQTVDGAVSRGDGSSTDTEVGSSSTGRLLAAHDGIVVVASRGGFTILDASGEHAVDLGSDGALETAVMVEVADATVAVRTDSTVAFYDLDGTRRFGELGAGPGALSPDGRRYATAQGLGQIGTGDDHRGAATLPADLEVIDATWTDDGLHAITASGTGRSLWDCGTTGLDCREIFNDPTGTLTLR